MSEDHTPHLTRRQLRERREAGVQNTPRTTPEVILETPQGATWAQGSGAETRAEPISEAKAGTTKTPKELADEPAAEGEDPTPAKPQRAGAQIMRAIGTGVMAGILLIVLAIGAMAIIVPAATGSRALTVLTSSMEPAIPPGTLIVVKPQDAKSLEAGDVLTYQLKSGQATLVTHRIQQQLTLANGSAAFITKGDNNPQADPDPVQEAQVVGKLWYSIPFVGWVSNAFTGDARTWIIPIVVGALFVYAAWMVFSGLREKRKKAESGTEMGTEK